MSQTSALVGALKKILRSRGITYRELASQLGASEASVKRWFAAESFSLERLGEICALMDLGFADLVQEMEREQHQLSALSETQEAELVADEVLLLVAFVVIHGWTYGEILQRFRLEEPALLGCLTRLDRLGLIELMPGNRIRLRVSPRFTWRPNGPIQRYFISHLLEEFLASPFCNADEKLMFLPGMLSRSSSEVVRKKLEKLAAEFAELNQEDRQLPYVQRHGYSLLIALRPWRADVFDRLSR
ncbi:helix-turn-helix transcriptional regulator [Azovibrio restrictus]|uniref:helix-turn-helix domain-containing protein n=1 Tax=Azovibrio restrictus TaxID=146938 RepID=UPI0026EFAE92|nr:helix-turn-helix transcriptional regulator [Azovibrio restrictus]MDD3484431.1 helix-turn-helix transcriptional regulator [Azovibrio restrictus]